ncbi:MAG: alpha/beta hydrolase [Pseudomonadota bacterium]
MNTTPWPDFTHHREKLRDVVIGWSMGGSGPPLLLLHGFPQTRALWSVIAPHLARDFTVICPDLRGYGESDKPRDVAAYSFREMARDQVALLDHLGLKTCAVAGHDRGGRVAHRLLLDHAERITRASVMDIIPTHTLLNALTPDVAATYYHWFFLAQPEPLPEKLIGSDPDGYYATCLAGWGKAGLDQFHPAQLAEYRAAWNDPDTIRGMCNDYRAALAQDIKQDAADLDKRVICPLQVLYGAQGVMAENFDFAQCWSEKATDIHPTPMPGGHFFIDTHPEETLVALRQFFLLQDIKNSA